MVKNYGDVKRLATFYTFLWIEPYEEIFDQIFNPNIVKVVRFWRMTTLRQREGTLMWLTYGMYTFSKDKKNVSFVLHFPKLWFVMQIFQSTWTKVANYILELLSM